MRIKKKHVLKESLILEGLLIDDLKNISSLERKALKNLHKRYKDVSTWSIDSHDLIDELHETWGLSLHVAVKIVNTYIYKRDYLFKEHDYVYNLTKATVFDRYGRKFFKKFRDNLGNERLTPEGEFWHLKIGDESLPFEASFWDSWQGYTLYLPVDWDLRYRSRRDSEDDRNWDQYIILVDVNFDWEKDTFDITYRIGKDDNEQRGVIVESIPFEYPEGEISYDTSMEWIENHVMNITKPLVLRFDFPSVEDDGTGM